MKDAVSHTSSEYTKVVENVDQLTIHVDLAKKGLLDKTKVVHEYNESMGKVTGQVKSLDEVEEKLVKDGPAYIQMTLLKAAANYALEEAAKKTFEAEQLRRKKDEEFRNKIVDTRVSGGAIPGTGTFNAAEYDKETKRIKDAQEKRKNEQIKSVTDSEKELKDIAAKFQKDAADIANKFHFDFFGGTQDPSKDDINKGKKAAEEARKQREDDLKAEFDAYKSHQDRLATAFKDTADNEKNSFTTRTYALQQYIKIRQDLLEDEAAIELAINKHSDTEIKATRSKLESDKLKIAYDATKALEKIEADNNKRLKDLSKEHNFDVVAEYGGTYKELHKLLEKHFKDQEDSEKDALDKEKEYLKKRKDAFQKLGEELTALAFELADAQYQKEEDAIQGQIDALEKRKQKEIEVANQSILNSQQRADAIAVIEARAQAEREALEKRQRKIQEERAKFEKAHSIADIIQSTVVAVVSALGAKPWTPANIALAAIVGAIGAAQIAKVIATPIPHYATGTEDHKGGLAVVGDAGVSEYVQTPDGKIHQTPSRATVVNLPAHSKVWKDEMAMMNAIANHHMTASLSVKQRNQLFQDKNITTSIGKMESSVVKAIKNIPQPIYEGKPGLKGWVHGNGSQTRYI
jgi:hypothetical protein